MKIALITTVAIFALAAPLASQAQGNSGHGKGHAAHAKGHAEGHAKGNTAHGKGKQGHAARQSGAWTPPGLAKKPHGMPPGQAKKMWSQGENLPTNYVADRYAVPYPAQYNLGPAPYGSRWVQVGDRYYLAQTKTGVISQVVSALIR